MLISRICLTFLVLFSLVACGGGGDGTPNTSQGNLAVGYSYAGVSTAAYTLRVFAVADLPPPQVSQLGSNTPHFAIVSGRLPPGLSLDASTGKITGVPVSSGSFAATIRLTVDGFSGSLDSTFQTGVNDIGLSYSPAGSYEVGVPLSGLGPVFAPSPIPGLSITYGLQPYSAPLPAGLSINSLTGFVEGIPLGTGQAYVQIFVNTAYNGVTSTASASVNLDVRAVSAIISYDKDSTLVNIPLQANASASSAQPGDTLSNFTVTFGPGESLPPGTSVDPATGKLSGTPTVAGSYSATVHATLTRGAYVVGISGPLVMHVLP